MPDGESVPLMFSKKELSARASGSALEPGLKLAGSYYVPSYRGELFQDPIGRGGALGYDQQPHLMAMQADGNEGQDALFRYNNKKYTDSTGNSELIVTDVDAASGDIAGTFVSRQEADSDMGAKDPKMVILKGVWSAHVPGVGEA